jgi:hypothetical protein
MEPRVEDRSKSFMKPFDNDDLKRRRGKNEVSLRKSKRHEMAQNKRNLQINQRDWI